MQMELEVGSVLMQSGAQTSHEVQLKTQNFQSHTDTEERNY